MATTSIPATATPILLPPPSPSFSPPSSSRSARRLSLRSLPTTLPTIRKRSQAPSSTLFAPEAKDPLSLSRSPSLEEPSSATYSRPVSRTFNHSRSTSDPVRSSTTSIASSHTRADNPWNQKSLSKRISWGWNQTFSGLTPVQLTEVSIQRAQAVQIIIPPHAVRRDSIASSASASSEATSSTANTSTPATASRPFAGRKYSLNNLEIQRSEPIEPSLFTVEEETKESPELDPDFFDEMGLARSLTRRLQRSDSVGSLVRIKSDRKQRPTISLPIALLSSTNDMANCEDISHGFNNSGSTTPTSEAPELTDNSSIGSRSSSGSPRTSKFTFSSPTVSPNHLSQYFASADNKDLTTIEILPVSPASSENSPVDILVTGVPPAIPRRAASHSKREHVRLARARSVRSSVGYSMSEPSSRHASLQTTSEEVHPFANELNQLNEVQEDFNSMIIEQDAEADEEWLASAGYRQFTSSAYCESLVDLEAGRFQE